LVIKGASITKTIFDYSSSGTEGSSPFMTITASNVTIRDFAVTRYGTQTYDAHALIIGNGAKAAISGDTVRNVQIDHCGASSGSRRAMAIKSGATVTMSGGGATCNNSWSVTGGITLMGTNINLTLSYYTFSGTGISATNGACLYMDNASQNVILKNSQFSTNAITGGTGKGVDIYMSNGTLQALDCIFDGSTSGPSAGTNIGGSISILGGTATFKRSKFINNSGGSCNGAAIGNAGGTVTIDSCYFEGNSGSGANDVHCSSGSISASYCVFEEIGQSGGTFTIVNSGNPVVIEGTVTKTNTTVSTYSANPTASGVISGSCAARNIILPIELIYFTAKENSTIVELKWATSSEINNNFFTIERSRNAVDFEDLTYITAAKNSNSTICYQTIDQNPLQGMSYYRLKQTDLNGNYSYSEVQAVNFEAGNEFNCKGVTILSDNHESVYVQACTTVDQMNIILTDAMGRVLVQKVYQDIESGTNLKIDMPQSLIDGIYICSIYTKQGVVSKKIVIVK
jgi:hypothetical protein